MAVSSMDGDTSSLDESVIGGCHPWMEKPHPWMTSTDEDDRLHTWTEQKCHQWMSSMDEDDG